MPIAKTGKHSKTEPINSEAQQWMKLHPARFQECADRRPLLQQSRLDRRVPGSNEPPDASFKVVEPNGSATKVPPG